MCEKRSTITPNPTYTVEHYLQNIEDDEYEILRNTFTMDGTVGDIVTAEEKTYIGFEYDDIKSSSTKSGTVTADGSLVLKLYYKRNKYKLTFNGNGGTPDSLIIEGKYESPITPPDDPVQSGYVFVGWDKDIPSTMPAEDIDFTAEWAVKIPGEYKVRFYLQTISTPHNPVLEYISTETKTYNTDVYVGQKIVIDESNAPVKEGFTFDKDSTEFGGKLSGIVTNSPILELSLFYSRNRYNLTLTKGEGIKTVSGDGNYYYEEEVNLYCELEEGYKFKNYTKDTNEISNNSDYLYTIPSSDVTIVANGEPIEYTINYNLDSGTNDPSNPSTYTIKDNDFTIQNPTRSGYFFEGWTSDEILTPTKEIVISQGSMGDIELTANWISTTVDLSPSFAENDVIYLDGSKLTVNSSTSLVINEYSKQITKYVIENDSETDVHLKYPSNMLTYFLEKESGQIVPKRKENFDDIMIYEGASIRMTGKKGIRIITGIPTDKKNLLVNSNIDGYKVMEYGTVLCWADDLTTDEEPTLYLDTASGTFKATHGAKGRAFSRTDGINAIFNESGGISRYTNTLVESSDGQWTGKCGNNFAMRSYIIICPTDSTSLDDYIVLYGGTLIRSIAYVAYQNRNTYTSGTDAYEYIWGLIKDGYGDTYDSEYITE